MRYPVLYKRGTTNFNHNGKGVLLDAFDVKVKEIINDIFTLDFNYPITSKLGNEIMNGDIIRVDASNVLRDQKFRVMSITQNDDLTISVHCLHKTFDTATDYIKGPLNLEKASCEYALNMLFNNSMKSKNYIGVSDIQNAQNFSCTGKQLADALVGSTGSIIDTYGLGAQIERDNSDGDKIKVLKRRGKDTNILISYGKNITGYKCVLDEQSLATILVPVATNNNSQEKIIGTPLYAPNYQDFDGELYIVEVDVTDRFKENEEITISKLTSKAEAYMQESKCNIPKLTYTIDFEKLDTSTLPNDYNLEKLYAVNIGDTLIVRHKHFKVDTQAKVNSIEYDPIAQKYTKIVFGDVRASFGSTDSVIQGPPGQDGKTYYTWIKYADTPTSGMSDDPNGKAYLGIAQNKETPQASSLYEDYLWSKIKGDDGSIEDFPNTLPNVPKLSANVVGITGIDISWTFVNKLYYTYELYASQVPDFQPTVFDKIFEGKASSYKHDAQPNENWYFKVRAVNSFGRSTRFSEQVKVTTNTHDNFDEYFSSLAVTRLVADIFSVNHMHAGIVKGNWIDAKNLTVTDGNGKRTLDIDSYGNVNLDVTSLKIQAKQVSTEDDIKSAILSTNANILPNSNFLKKNGRINGWTTWSNNENTMILDGDIIWGDGEGVGLYNPKKLDSVIEYHSEYLKVGGVSKVAISSRVYREESVASAKLILRQLDEKFDIITDSEISVPELHDGPLSHVFNILDERVQYVRVVLHNGGTWQNTPEKASVYFNRIMVTIGPHITPWRASNLDQITDRYSKIESDLQGINLEVGKKVSNKEIISAINLSPEKIKIDSNNIEITGATSIGHANDGRYVSIENETFRVMNGDTPCMHLGYRTWQGYTGVPEFLMGRYGFIYSDQQGAPWSGTYFGMSTFGEDKNPENTVPYHSIYYRSRTRADESQLNFYENGKTKLKSMGDFALIADGHTHMNASRSGLVFNNGFHSYKQCIIDDNLTLNKNILMNGQIYTKDLKQGFGIEQYWGRDEYMLRKMTINPMDLGYDTAESRFRNIYAENGVINTSDISLKTNIVPIKNTGEITPASEDLSTNDFYEFIKNLQFYKYDYVSGNCDPASHNVGFIANEIADTAVGSEFIFKDKDNLYQYNLQGYIGVMGVALQAEINKNELQSKRIDALEETVHNLVAEIEMLKRNTSKL